MGLIVWGDAYSVDVAEIDSQHQELVTIINDLHDAIYNNETVTVLDQTIPKLVTYAQKHFTTEEGYMIKYDYPHYQDHKLLHQEFLNEVTLLVQEIERGEKVLSISLFTFLKDWLLNHIAYTDKKLGDFLNTHRIPVS